MPTPLLASISRISKVTTSIIPTQIDAFKAHSEHVEIPQRRAEVQAVAADRELSYHQALLVQLRESCAISDSDKLEALRRAAKEKCSERGSRSRYSSDLPH